MLELIFNLLHVATSIAFLILAAFHLKYALLTYRFEGKTKIFYLQIAAFITAILAAIVQIYSIFGELP